MTGGGLTDIKRKDIVNSSATPQSNIWWRRLFNRTSGQSCAQLWKDKLSSTGPLYNFLNMSCVCTFWKVYVSFSAQELLQQAAE